MTDGSNPAICHIHAGRNASPIIPDEIDEIKILKKLARDSNPQIRLRAVDLLLDLKAKRAESPHHAREQESELFLDVLTDEEIARLDAILEMLRDFKEEVWAREPVMSHSSAERGVDPRSVTPRGNNS